ncbi:MAG: cytochrome-c peroxidase [Bacteroidetes bacterium]|nr:cytochrome-c peroxidase [Bacteroidota bacterium]MBU1721019.1 cytochrome-c peroxidase [Bacteroidota bacterium]
MKRNKLISPAIVIALTITLIVLVNCKKEDPISPLPENIEAYNPTPWVFEIPYGFPTEISIPEDNPLTEEGIELGRHLFYDGRLAGRDHLDSLMSCSSCHRQNLSFELGSHPVSTISGIQTPHVMLPLINLAWNPGTYLWNGKVKQIEDLVWMGIVAPHEMNSDTNRAVAMLRSIPMYAEMCKKAFGTDQITIDLASKAIAQFIMTLVSANSKFDRYLRGEYQLSAAELDGFVLFTTEEGADCFHCHGASGNPLFTTHLFYNNGKDSVFNDTRDRFAVTGDPMDIGAYKATTLRNIEFTGPYMHDGRFQTLEEVINFYSESLIHSPSISPLMHHLVYGGNQLTPTEKQNLLAFLKSLTDTDFLTNPAFSNPRPTDPFFIN